VPWTASFLGRYNVSEVLRATLMPHDPLFTSWLVECPSAEESQRLQHWLRTAIRLDTTYEDIVRPSPEGAASSVTRVYLLGDYFTDIRLLPGEPTRPLAFRIVFSRRSEAGQFWKDLMVRTLQEVRKSSPDTTTTLEYQREEPISRR
jgi:hypothetical protein